MIKITVSVCGRFHAFELAHQLEKKGQLHRLITSYPVSLAVRAGIPSTRVQSLLPVEILNRALARLPRSMSSRFNPQFFMAELYDRLAARYIDPCDLCIAWSSFGLHTLRKARDLGALTVIERGSSHIAYQTRILEEEYGRLGLCAEVAHPKVVGKEIIEYQEADLISVPSSFVKRTFLAEGVPEKKIIQTSFGAKLILFHPLARKDQVFRPIFVGTMSIRKGLHYLLQVFSELRLPDSELLLVGPATAGIKPFLQRFDGQYRWVGPQPRSQLASYYAQSSVFVLMSIEEGMAMVIPQAMACGLPVICTTNSGGEDIVRDGIDGFVIPIRDTEALKEKLRFLYENPDVCNQMGHSARERVSSGFTWDDYGDRITAAYQRILAERNH